MSNDYKFKLGLALAREQALIEKVKILGARLAAATCEVKYDDTLLPFLALMRKELHANSHKGDRDGWLKMDVGRATHEIYHHYEKLENAAGSRDFPQIAEYCADLANCAMMLADVCGLLGQPNNKPKKEPEDGEETGK